MFIIDFIIDFYVYYSCILKRIVSGGGRGTTKDLKKKISYNTINMQGPLQHLWKIRYFLKETKKWEFWCLLLILLSIFMFIILVFNDIKNFLASHLYVNKRTSTKNLEQLEMKLSYNTIEMQVPL